MSRRARLIKGIGRESNPIDGDQIVIGLGVRDGKIAYVGADDIRTGFVPGGGGQQEVSFKRGAEARAQGHETFGGCETARRAALVLHKVFIGREIEAALAMSASDIIAQMAEPQDDQRCVTTVLGAVRNAVIDVQVTALAEAIVEVRSLREASS